MTRTCMKVTNQPLLNESDKCVGICLPSWWDKKYVKWQFSMLSKCMHNFMTPSISPEPDDSECSKTFYFKETHIKYLILVSKNIFQTRFKYYSINTKQKRRFPAIFACFGKSFSIFKYRLFSKLFFIKILRTKPSIYRCVIQ
jgi:hypothetical protein